MNTRLLRRVQKAILAEPRQFRMESWFEEVRGVPNCGTTACIGGWAICLARNFNPAKGSDWSVDHFEPPVAQKHLEINDDQAERLFYKSNWPRKFRGGRNATERAKKAVARIDHFIKTRGRK